MLEQIHRTPEERRKNEIILHAGTIVFALYSFTELAAQVGLAALVAGAAIGLFGAGYSRWLRSCWREELREVRDSHAAEHNGPYRLQAM